MATKYECIGPAEATAILDILWTIRNDEQPGENWSLYSKEVYTRIKECVDSERFKAAVKQRDYMRKQFTQAFDLIYERP